MGEGRWKWAWQGSSLLGRPPPTHPPSPLPSPPPFPPLTSCWKLEARWTGPTRNTPARPSAHKSALSGPLDPFICQALPAASTPKPLSHHTASRGLRAGLTAEVPCPALSWRQTANVRPMAYGDNGMQEKCDECSDISSLMSKQESSESMEGKPGYDVLSEIEKFDFFREDVQGNVHGPALKMG